MGSALASVFVADATCGADLQRLRGIWPKGEVLMLSYATSQLAVPDQNSASDLAGTWGVVPEKGLNRGFL